MTKKEKAMFDKLLVRQKLLRAEIKRISPYFEIIKETDKRIFDQHYGECLGIEYALANFSIAFESVDD